MSAKFLEGFSGKLAEQWVSTLLTPAFVFWAGGAVAIQQTDLWAEFTTWFSAASEPLQIAALVAAFCLIAASAFVVQRFDQPVLRLLEGYWHPWLRPLRRRMIARQQRRSQQISDRWQTLKALNVTPHKAEHHDELVQLDWQLMHRPIEHSLMPTDLGNLLRAAEQRPREKYGLDAVICWPRLWMLLPDGVKQDLQAARADLNAAARVCLWSLLFLVWTRWAWWAVLVSILSAILAYNWALSAAAVYGDLVEATFDVHRHLLYQALRWNLPTDPDEERRVGRDLTAYLWRGF